MKILIVGGDGMLGHQLFKSLSRRHETKVTLRQGLGAYAEYGLFDRSNAYDDIDARSTNSLLEAVADFRPQVIVNGAGVVKQNRLAKESIPTIEINALLPQRLAVIAKSAGARLVHFSTDCVFSGQKGNYSESDRPDPPDLYGYSKLLGEVVDSHCLTLRTSVIGHELARRQSLIEWFLAQTGVVHGYTNAVFSGFTTIEIARIVEMVLVEHPNAHGLWHVSSEPIDKYSLLSLVKKHYEVPTGIVPDGALQCDRSLNSQKFRERFRYKPPDWEMMIAEMKEERSKK
jgi:dTDP-4-dehydrorhamnose reductase